MSEAVVLDEQALIETWIAGCKSASTRNLYRRQASAFLLTVKKPLSQIVESDVRTYFEDRIQGTAGSRSTALSAIKSLLSFAFKVGFIKHNPGTKVQVLSERYQTPRFVIDHCDIERMIFQETDERNFAILMVSYSGGLHVSELAALTWADVVEHRDGALLRVVGSEGKPRDVLISPASWNAVSVLRGSSKTSDPVFLSKKGGHMHPSAVHRVVKAAVLRAGLPEKMSTSWLRHAQTAHSLDDGKSLEDLQSKLGHSEISTTMRYVRQLVPNGEQSRAGR